MILFGVCVADQNKFESICLPSIQNLVSDVQIDLVTTSHPSSIYEAYNAILDHARSVDDYEAVVLLHEDVEILDRDFIAKLQRVIAEIPKLGVLGVIGARKVTSLRWWEAPELVGRVYENRGIVAHSERSGEVACVDGLLMVLTSKAFRQVAFDSDTYGGFHGYDVDYCFDVRTAGLEVHVADIDIAHHTKGSYGDSVSFQRTNSLWCRKHGFESHVKPASWPVNQVSLARNDRGVDELPNWDQDRPVLSDEDGHMNVRFDQAAARRSNRSDEDWDVVLALPDVDTNIHARAFDEVADTMAGGFERLGLRVGCHSHRNHVPSDVPTVVLAPHLYDLDRLRSLPSDTTVLYNWEQLGRGGTNIVSSAQREAMAQFILWDYSSANVAGWQAAGVRAVHVPLGYDPSLERLGPSLETPDFDVVHIGSVNERRLTVLEELANRGLRVHVAFGVYGADRDELLRRSRIVVNLHFYDSAILELARLSYLWANRMPVVCEIGPSTRDDLGMAPWCLRASYESLADRVEQVLRDPTMTDRVAEACYQRFCEVGDSAVLLRRALRDTLEVEATTWERPLTTSPPATVPGFTQLDME